MGVDDRDGAFDPADSCDATTERERVANCRSSSLESWGDGPIANLENIPGVTQE